MRWWVFGVHGSGLGGPGLPRPGGEASPCCWAAALLAASPGPKSLANRSSVIFICSMAAFCSSAAGAFANLHALNREGVGTGGGLCARDSTARRSAGLCIPDLDGCQHLFCALAACTDDEDVVKLLLILGVPLRQLLQATARWPGSLMRLMPCLYPGQPGSTAAGGFRP